VFRAGCEAAFFSDREQVFLLFLCSLVFSFFYFATTNVPRRHHASEEFLSSDLMNFLTVNLGVVIAVDWQIGK
jgi:hypothetical protein